MEKVFESDNIIFIKLNENLIDEYLKMVNDPEVANKITREIKIYTKEEEKEWIELQLKEHALCFSMLEKGTNNFIGNIEIRKIVDNIGELGIVITPCMQNKHYGTESIKRILKFAYEELNLVGMELIVYSTNSRAIHCYEKIGFRRIGEGKTPDDIKMGIIGNLRVYSDEKIVELIKEGKIGVADIVDSGICPTCFDRKYNNILYGNNVDKILYEDENIECFLVSNPRANGHVAISSKVHYKDMMEIDEELCNVIFTFAKRMMNIIKEVYNAESVYLCTMCDGPMNHFHIQLIPRYDYEKRGSKNFVKSRFEYIEQPEKIKSIIEKLSIK